MRYLTVDGMAFGTGVRDLIDGGFVDIEKLGLSVGLTQKIQLWLSKYCDEHECGYINESLVSALDKEGIAIAKYVQKELSNSKIEYFSSWKMERVLIESIPNDPC